jgi:uncharacterized alpha-E superfamily protein
MRAVSAPPTGYGPPLTNVAEVSSDERLTLTIAACVAAARENARQGREQISSEMWEQLNRLYLYVRQHDNAAADSLYMHVTESAHLFQGVTDSTMIHAEGWHYIQIGRSIERASATAAMIEHFDQPDGARGPGHPRVYFVDVKRLLRVRSVPALHGGCARGAHR